MDWQFASVLIIVAVATYVSVKTFCFGNKKSKCHDCAVKCKKD